MLYGILQAVASKSETAAGTCMLSKRRRSRDLAGMHVCVVLGSWSQHSLVKHVVQSGFPLLCQPAAENTVFTSTDPGLIPGFMFNIHDPATISLN